MSETTETRLKKFEMDVNQLTVEHLKKLIREMHVISFEKSHPMYRIVDDIDPLELDPQSRQWVTNILISMDHDEMTAELINNIESEWLELLVQYDRESERWVPIRYDRESKKWVPIIDDEYHSVDIIRRLHLSIVNSVCGGLIIRPYGHPE